MTPLPLGSTIGIVGGGQLGRMSAMAAARLGYRTHVLTDAADSPAAQVAAGCTVGAYDDVAALRALADASDVITFEFENVSSSGLDLLAGRRPVRPGPQVLRISQDRRLEKAFLTEAGVRTARWATTEDVGAALGSVGLPAIVKTARLGYDGKGQRRVETEAQARAAIGELPAPTIIEAAVDFACEISVVLARGADGAIAAFDATENAHRAGILELSFAPARVGAGISDAAQRAARTVAERLDLVGLLCVEFFVDQDGALLANEIAPRPHNSGHWTLDACPMSQFEAHVRAVAGLPLPPALRHSDAVMRNLIGPEGAALWLPGLSRAGIIPHWYGKAEARPGRKLGHVTRLFPLGSLPGELGVQAALGPLAPGDQD
jgi:5-(carboxyamino)imidazole ribonucleotide synthase